VKVNYEYFKIFNGYIFVNDFSLLDIDNLNMFLFIYFLNKEQYLVQYLFYF